MKTTLCFLLTSALVTSARAEIFRSGTNAPGHGPGPGVVHGGPAHHDNGHYGYGHSGSRVYVGVGFGSPYYYGAGWYSPYRASPVYGYYDGYGYGYPYYDYGYYGSGSSAANGLVLGALAGGVIGNNSGAFNHSGWRGAAWGAGIGWLLGTVADANRPRVVYSQPAVISQPAATVNAAAAQPATGSAQPQQITIINNYYNSSPMSGANTLFGR